MSLRKPGWAAALAVAAAFFAPTSAWSALVGCTLSLPALSGGYSDTANLDASGVVTVTCTRDNNGKDDYYLRLNLAQTSTETMSTPYPDTLNYGIYTDTLRSVRWTAQEATLTLSGNVKVGSAALTAYLRVPSGQSGKAAGLYNASIVATLQLLTGPGGGVTGTLATSSLGTQVTVPKSCALGTTLPSYSLTYQAFQTAALANSSQNLSLTCTKGTSYTLTLDQTTGIVPTVELRYQLVFTSSAGPAVSALATTGTAAQHGLTLTLPAGQAGACATGTCTGSSVRTVTVSY